MNATVLQTRITNASSFTSRCIHSILCQHGAVYNERKLGVLRRYNQHGRFEYTYGFRTFPPLHAPRTITLPDTSPSLLTLSITFPPSTTTNPSSIVVGTATG